MVHLLRDPSVGTELVWIQLSSFTLRAQHRIGHPRREEEMIPCSVTGRTSQTLTVRFQELGCQKTFSWRANRSAWIMVGIRSPSQEFYDSVAIAQLGIIPPHHICVS